MKKFLLSLFAAALMALPAAAESLTVNGQTRTYNIIVPKNLGENRPLLIFCHGYNQDANWMQNSEFKNDNVSMEAVCDTAKFICVFPNGIDRAWDVGGDRDINFIKAIIEKMVTQHKIDRNRVYLGGFSMGGMLTYNAINKMSEQIAAFVSCSGPSVVTPKSGLRPIPLLHIQGTADNWGGVQPALNPWINHNGCSTQDKVINNYNGFSGAKLHIWGPGNDGVEVRLIELKDKGHWICKEPQVYTGKEIWNFCKKYSLAMESPQVRITSPTSDLTYLTFGGQSQVGTIDIDVTATDPNGVIKKVQLFDGDNLIGTDTTAPYHFAVSSLTKGKHNLRVVATDNENCTGEARLAVTLEEPTVNYVFTKIFNTEGSVPQGWQTFDGNEKRTGYAAGFSSGCRVFHFTGEQHDFEWGLYVRNIEGRTNEGYARFAAPETSTKLMLYPGNYNLLHRIANWNIEEFAPVRIAIERADGTVAYEETITPTVNIGNSAENSFSGTTMGTVSFDIYEQGQYQITFYTADQAWADAVVGQAALRYKSAIVVGIEEKGMRREERGAKADQLFDLQGRPVSPSSSHHHGIFISNGRKIVK